MGIIDTLKGLAGGDPHDDTRRAADAPDDNYLGTQLAPSGADADVPTTQADPMVGGVGMAGLQAPFKPAEVEREPDPERRRGRE